MEDLLIAIFGLHYLRWKHRHQKLDPEELIANRVCYAMNNAEEDQAYREKSATPSATTPQS